MELPEELKKEIDIKSEAFFEELIDIKKVNFFRISLLGIKHFLEDRYGEVFEEGYRQGREDGYKDGMDKLSSYEEKVKVDLKKIEDRLSKMGEKEKTEWCLECGFSYSKKDMKTGRVCEICCKETKAENKCQECYSYGFCEDEQKVYCLECRNAFSKDNMKTKSMCKNCCNELKSRNKCNECHYSYDCMIKEEKTDAKINNDSPLALSFKRLSARLLLT